MSQIKPLSPALQKVAIEKLGEVLARIPEDLEALKTWIQQQPHLKARTDDQFLIHFLRGCKYSLEKVKQKIDMFYAMKTKYPQLFVIDDVDNVQFRKLHNKAFFVALPTPLNDNGQRIIMVRFTFSSQDFDISETFRYYIAASEMIMLNDEYASVQGIVAVVDCAQVTANHLLQTSLNSIMTYVRFYEKAVAGRVKAVYFINLPKYVEQFLRLLLPHLSEKTKQWMHICGKDLDDLSQHLPKKYLPRDYGGENGWMVELCAEFNKVWDDNREFFKQNAQYGTDERLRVGTPIAFDGDLGSVGSFRKLITD